MIKENGEGLHFIKNYRNVGSSSFGSNIGILQNISKLDTEYILSYISNLEIFIGSLLRLNKNYSNITQSHNFNSQASPEYFGLGTIDEYCSRSFFSNIMVWEVIFYSQALNPKQILQIKEYLDKKYSIKLID